MCECEVMSTISLTAVASIKSACVFDCVALVGATVRMICTARQIPTTLNASDGGLRVALLEAPWIFLW